MSKSTLFTAYNAAKPLCEAGRLNRALGIAQRKDTRTQYETTASTCSCPDYFYRHTRCKHIISLILTTVAS